MCFPLSCHYAEHPWPRTNSILQLANTEEHSGQSALAPSTPIYDTDHAQSSHIPVFLQVYSFLFQMDILSGGNWKTRCISLVLLMPTAPQHIHCRADTSLTDRDPALAAACGSRGPPCTVHSPQPRSTRGRSPLRSAGGSIAPARCEHTHF